MRVELKESALSLSHQQRCDICHQLRHHIKSIVGVSTDVSIANCGDIPRSEGKAQRVVDCGRAEAHGVTDDAAPN